VHVIKKLQVELLVIIGCNIWYLPSGKYYFAISEWDSSPVPFYVPPSPALGVIRYKNASPSQGTPYSPEVPSATDSVLANAFRSSLFGLTNYTLPEKMDRDLVFAVGVATIVCKPDENCAFFKGKKLGGAINNVTFDNPTNSSILESFFYHTKGVYNTDFPPVPPAIVNFTSTSVVASYSLTSHRGTNTLKLKYNETVQLVLQDLDSLSLEDHPFHLHGHNFYVVGTGLGNFNAMTDQKNFNLVDPPMRHTVTIPYGGWVAIRFIANNPGECMIHKHSSCQFLVPSMLGRKHHPGGRTLHLRGFFSPMLCYH
jgi:laccase